MSGNSTGSNNTAIGMNSLQANTTANDNVAVGASAMLSNASGTNNTGLGVFALAGNLTGNNNTACGSNALWGNLTGNSNIALGYQAGRFRTSGDNNIDIGHQGIPVETGTIRIGAVGTHTRIFVAAVRGTTTDSNDAIPVLVDASGQLGTISSSRRFKDDIADMGEASSVLMKMRPVTFHYKADPGPAGRRLQYGLIAEEVADIAPGLVARSADGQIETVLYQFLPPMLLNEYQKQQRTIQAQMERIADLERSRRDQAAEIASLKRQAALVAEVLRSLTHVEVPTR
jgi:hypothetical protein